MWLSCGTRVVAITLEWTAAIVLLMLSCPVFAQDASRPVTHIELLKDGTYKPGHMHWYTSQAPLFAEAEFAVLGEVLESSSHYWIGSRSDLHNGSLDIRIRADEVVLCPDALIADAAELRFLDISLKHRFESNDSLDMATESFETLGVEVGDTVVIFMARYEGQYALPGWIGGNTRIGYKLHQGPCDDSAFVALLRSGRAWDLSSMSYEELDLWRCVDAAGLLEQLIRNSVFSRSTSTSKPVPEAEEETKSD